ncbi:hypothetical protein [Vibrio mediterranei]|uniref:Uncharacterized protein n=1 Tax=Vibrio mediterranei TaxID=689 RepID=A0A3G4VDC5_9VIBR|nr:hypothetical protein [Vibrio mediterranei]AYV22757.1 hypothetical protein ECB94_16515 [Vibrio mediterranei]
MEKKNQMKQSTKLKKRIAQLDKAIPQVKSLRSGLISLTKAERSLIEDIEARLMIQSQDCRLSLKDALSKEEIEKEQCRKQERRQIHEEVRAFIFSGGHPSLGKKR